MKRFFFSFFFRVAIGLAAAMIAGVWFVATHITPDATYVRDDGVAQHVFWQGVFITRAVMAYFLLLLPVYGVARVVRWLTASKPGSA